HLPLLAVAIVALATSGCGRTGKPQATVERPQPRLSQPATLRDTSVSPPPYVPVASSVPAVQPSTSPTTQPTTRPATTQSDDPIARIRDEGMNRSQVMETASFLMDVIGPRLTGSPNLRRANEWTRQKLESWGLVNGHLEPWGTFGRGWSLVRFS